MIYGIVKDNMDVNDNYFKNHLLSIDTTKDSKTISNELLKFVLKESKELLDDDVTIIITKIVRS